MHKFRTVLWGDLKTGKTHVLDVVDKTIDGKAIDEKNFWSGIHDVQVGGKPGQGCERQAAV